LSVPALPTVIARRPPPTRDKRDAHVVVLAVEEPPGAQLVRYGHGAERRVVPAPRVIDVIDLGASGVIRKRSKPPLR